MLIQINNASNRPVYQQIVDYVKRQVALGRLKVAEKLPTVRELAGDLVINPNTIGKAYRQLEQEGIIVTRPGAGAFIAELSNNLSNAVRERMLAEQLDLLVVDAVHMQVDRRTLTRWFEKTLKKFSIE